ncbi:MAG TPA: glycosyltransferase family 2 protein [Hanamia sp.]
MKVTIITVTLNSEKYLSDCIASVRQQSHRDIEHIIIDGKSTDGTLKIIRDNSAYITNWISETDRGMYDAINKGMKMATGDIIGILNSDDMLASPDVIRNIAECFKNSKTDAVYGDLVFVDPADTKKITRFWKGISYKRYRFKYGWMPAHPTFYIRRGLIQQYGLYENHYFTSADYEFMARYLFRHKVSATYLEQMVVKMRTGGASNGNLMRRLRANRRDYLAMKKNHIPFSFFVSILKPLGKIRQYHKAFLKKAVIEYPQHSKPTIIYLPSDGKTVSAHVEVLQ